MQGDKRRVVRRKRNQHGHVTIGLVVLIHLYQRLHGPDQLRLGRRIDFTNRLDRWVELILSLLRFHKGGQAAHCTQHDESEEDRFENVSAHDVVPTLSKGVTFSVVLSSGQPAPQPARAPSIRNS